ncbi:hypothetical protein JQ625_23755 [Bradyrhizobium diazoefficiens]|nr:hypothetical protein [Bradyrhizobium diazoefficiens]MBR0777862.1 hypothetical protein [Bradyrhizobium diazoefficiens]
MRQQQQRRIGLLELDPVLIGDPTRDREQPAREQVRIERQRDQDREHERGARDREQDELLPARQRQQIERGEQRAEHQLERHHEAQQARARDMTGVGPVFARGGSKQQRKGDRRQHGAENGKIPRGQNPFEADEGAERPEAPQPDLAQARAPASGTGQHEAAKQSEQDEDAAVVTDEKAARAYWAKGVERHRQIGIGEFRALQILHEIGIEPAGMRIDGGAVDADVPAVVHVERGVVGEIAERQQRHQRDQAGKPQVSRRAEIGGRPPRSCCSGNIGHKRIPSACQDQAHWTGGVSDSSLRWATAMARPSYGERRVSCPPPGAPVPNGSLTEWCPPHPCLAPIPKRGLCNAAWTVDKAS